MIAAWDSADGCGDQLTPYRLPGVAVVMIREDVARGQAEISYTLQGGQIVTAIRWTLIERERQFHRSNNRISRRRERGL